MRLKRFANLLSFSAAATLAAAAPAVGCPMCKASVANAANQDEISATINTAILILLAPTLAIIGGLVKLVFKYRNYDNFTTSGSERDTQQRQRDPAHHGLHLHSPEEHQGPQSVDD
jgi:hypothetical protein